MSTEVHDIIHQACIDAQNQGARLVRGPWFIWEQEKVVACDAIGAVLLTRNLIPPKAASGLRLGMVDIACDLLGVTPHWLYKFWMGWDRGYQILIYIERMGHVISTREDKVSAFGIRLSRLLVG